MEDSAAADLIERFLHDLWPEVPGGSKILIWTLPNKLSQHHTSLDSAIEAAKRLKETSEVYTGVCTRFDGLTANERGTYEQVSALSGVFVDLDFGMSGHKVTNLPPNAEEAIKLLDFEPRPTWLIHSGGGLQAWWLFREPWVFENDGDDDERHQAQHLCRRWQRFLQLRVAAAGWDMDNTADLPRVLRIPGTLNRKLESQGVLRPVKVIEASGLKYNPSELIELLDEMKVELAEKTREKFSADPEWAEIKLDPNAAVAAIDIEGLRMADARFDATWNHQRVDFQKQSMSEYDFSLANMAAIAGWPRQRIVNLILMHRKKYGAKQVSVSYYQRTVGGAMKRTAKDKKAPAKVIEMPTRPDLARGQALIDLSKLIGTRVRQFVKVGDEDPMYRLESDAGVAIFPSAEDWINQATFRRIVASRFDKVIAFLKPVEWKYFCDLLMQILVKEAADEETEITGRMMMWLNAYLEHKHIFQQWSLVEEMKDRTHPHLGDPEGDRGIYVNSTNLSGWIEKHFGERLLLKDLTARFKLIGAKSVVWRGGTRAQMSRHFYWKLPDDKFDWRDFETAEQARKEAPVYATARVNGHAADDVV